MAATMLERVKTALRITVDRYDDELTEMIEEARTDLGVLGVIQAQSETDPLIRRAIITYCRIHHGSPDDYDRLKTSYNELKGQLRKTSGYTVWQGCDVQ